MSAPADNRARDGGQGRISITGIGAVTPLGIGAQALHERWAAGHSEISGGRADCECFRAEDFLSKREIRASDRFTQLALAASAEAVAQAGWHRGLPYDADRIGCVIGTAIGGERAVEQEYATLLGHGGRHVSPRGVTRLMANAATAMVAIRYGLAGESFAVVSACAAGAQAIAMAARLIQSGSVDAVVSGGSDGGFTPLVVAMFESMGGTSRSGIARPFDRRRDGFVPGEGAGIVILEDAARAEARGAEPLGELLGSGVSTDAHHLAEPRPDGQGARRAMRQAIAAAGVSPASIDYVNAHGTGTEANDRVETFAIKAVFGDDWSRAMKVSSLKSATGHLQGAAGAVEAVATLLALRAGVAPPTLGLEDPDDGFDLDYVRDASVPLPAPPDGSGRIGMSNSFGLGGHNATLVIQAA